MADLVMPRLSDSMEEGTVLKWLKSVGDEVAVGEELVEIETDKANMVYESDAAGVLSEILAQEGDTLPIGEVIARVGDDVGGGGSGDDGGAAAGADSDRTSGGNGGGPSEDQAAPDVTKRERSEPAPATTPPPAPDPPAAPSAPAAAPSDPVTSSPSPSSSEPGARVKASPIAKRIASGEGHRPPRALRVGPWWAHRQGRRRARRGRWAGCRGRPRGRSCCCFRNCFS